MTWTFSIHAGTEDLSLTGDDYNFPKLASVSAVEAASVTIECIAEEPTPVLEGNQRNFVDGFSNTVNKGFKYDFRLDIDARDFRFPTTETKLENFYTYLDVLKYPYVWIYSDEFPLVSLDSTTAVAVDFISPETEHLRPQGIKKIALNFRTRNQVVKL